MLDKILVSAGEASGDRYAARLVEAFRTHYPAADFFGCAGPEMRRHGVDPVVESESLAVVGIAEVIHHIPRIYGEYKKLLAAAEKRKPAFAVLTDSPDFHLRVAARLAGMGIPVFYLVAPQAWAWREGRVRHIRRNVKQLHCIFPFEEDFFRQRGVEAVYIGHPLARMVQVRSTRSAFFESRGLRSNDPLVTLCPGSRGGEIARHLPILRETVKLLAQQFPSLQFVLALPEGSRERFGEAAVRPLLEAGTVTLVEGATWEAMAHAELTLAASGTVTIEAALLGAPMVTFYKVSEWTWRIGRPLVRVPFYSMVNLVAARPVVPELIQENCTPALLSREAGCLLADASARTVQRSGLAEVRTSLDAGHDALAYSAERIVEHMKGIV